MGCDREGRTVRLVRHENETATNVLHQSGCVAPKETPVGKIRLIDQPSRSTIEFAESAKSRRTAGWNVG
jgi:hypothetical protein